MLRRKNLGHSDLQNLNEPEFRTELPLFLVKSDPNSEESGIHANSSYPLWSKFFRKSRQVWVSECDKRYVHDSDTLRRVWCTFVSHKWPLQRLFNIASPCSQKEVTDDFVSSHHMASGA